MLRTIRSAKFVPPRYFKPSLYRRGLSTEPSGEQHGQKKESQPSEGHKLSEVKADNLSSDSEVLRDRLRKWSIENLKSMRTRMDEFSAMAQLTFSRLGGRLNEVTGYHEIEVLKRLVAENEKEMLKIRDDVKAAKEAYEQAVAKRSASQRETNDLLQRKSAWSEDDVLTFTRLVRADHLHEQEEARSKVRYAELDAASERQFAELMRTILARYHEEQVWSDKIRSASTYGSLAALGLNLLVFILAIVLVEPWKRRRLVESFEQRVVELNSKHQNSTEANLDAIGAQIDAQNEALAVVQAHLMAYENQVRSQTAAGDKDDVQEVSPDIQKPSSPILRYLHEHHNLAQTVAGSMAGLAVGFFCSTWLR